MNLQNILARKKKRNKELKPYAITDRRIRPNTISCRNQAKKVVLQEQ